MDKFKEKFGSFTKFAIWSKGKSDKEVEIELHKYGIKYKNLDEETTGNISAQDISAQNLTSCPERHWEYAGTHVRVGTGRYFIDSEGRPKNAMRTLPFSGDGTRSEYCQGRVGSVYSGVSGFYDGGHLIGNQLGGWGYRINLAPQNYDFNQNQWKAIETIARGCNALQPWEADRFWYEVDLEYPNGDTNIPDEWDVLVTYENRPEWWQTWIPAYEQEDADFANTYGGGWNGEDERRKIINFFAIRGCISGVQ